MILVGTHSKDNKVSLLLENRSIISQDGGNWTPLIGKLIVDNSLLAENTLPCVEVEAIFNNKTIINISQEKLIFSQIKVVENGDVHEGKTSFQFSYDFKSKALYSSFNLGGNDSIGVSWSILGYVAVVLCPGALSRDTLKLYSPTKCQLTVSNRYTKKVLEIMPDYESATAGTVKMSTLRSLFSKPPPNLTAKLINPIFDLESNIVINLEFGNIGKQQQIDTIKVILTQKIIVQLITSQQIKFKKEIVLFNQCPDPSHNTHLSYESEASLHLSHNIIIDHNFIKEQKQNLANTFPADINSDDTNFGYLTPSTIFQTLKPGIIGVNVEYSIKIIAQFQLDDRKQTFDTLRASLPLIVTSPKSVIIQDERYDYLTRDQFLPILDTLLKDLSQSLAGLSVLSSEWKSFRKSNEDMVTVSSDHAEQLLDIVDSFSEQLALFIDHLIDNTPTNRVKWKRDFVPFNMFLLELELLARATPAPIYEIDLSDGLPGNSLSESSPTLEKQPVETLLSSSTLFVTLSRKIVMSWIEPCEDDPRELVQKLHKEYLEVRQNLIVIADGGDHEMGEEKPSGFSDEDLERARLLSIS